MAMPMKDDDLDEPLSSRRALERADHGKTEKVDQKKKQDEKKLLSKLQLLVLQQSVSPQAKGAQDQLTDAEKQAGTDMGTKTLDEEVRQSTEGVDEKPQPKNLVEKGRQQEKAKEASAYEQNPGKSG